MKKIIIWVLKISGFSLMIIGLFNIYFSLIPGMCTMYLETQLSYDPLVRNVELVGTDFGGDDRFESMILSFDGPTDYSAFDLQVNEGISSYVQSMSSSSLHHRDYTYYLSTPTHSMIQKLGEFIDFYAVDRQLLHRYQYDVIDPLNDYTYTWERHWIQSIWRVDDTHLLVEAVQEDALGRINMSYPTYRLGLLNTQDSNFDWFIDIDESDATSFYQPIVFNNQIGLIFNGRIDIYSIEGTLSSTWNSFSELGLISYKDGYLWNVISGYQEDEEATPIARRVEAINSETGLMDLFYFPPSDITIHDASFALDYLYLAGSITQNGQKDALILLLNPTTLEEEDRIVLGGSKNDAFSEIIVKDSTIYTLGNTYSYDTWYFYDSKLVPPCLYNPFWSLYGANQDFYMELNHPEN